jgi:hypothetical protein
MSKKQTKLLSIISLGHSGSTLLDLVCGTLPGVFSMGEMHFLSWQLEQGEKENDPQSYCSCGLYFDECPFWSAILNEISQNEKKNIYLNPGEIDFSINRGIVRHKKYLKHDIMNKLFQLSYTYRFFKSFRNLVFIFYKKSIKKTWQLYDKIAIKSKSEYVVDSSKSINRALLLKMYRPKNVKLLILKRDVKGVASSSHEGLNDDMIKERTKHWFRYYHKRMPSYLSVIPKEDIMEVSYQNMCSSYNSLRKDIANFADLKQQNIIPIEHISPYKYHTVQGNPMRLLKKDVVIRYDKRWQERLNDEQIKWIKQHTLIK